jgi:hypothetical protein
MKHRDISLYNYINYMGHMTSDYDFQRTFKEVVVTRIMKVNIFVSTHKLLNVDWLRTSLICTTQSECTLIVFSCILYKLFNSIVTLIRTVMFHEHPLLGNGLLKKFPLMHILGEQSVARLRNNT